MKVVQLSDLKNDILLVSISSLIVNSDWHGLSAGFFWLPAPVSGNTRTSSHRYGFARVYPRVSQGSAGTYGYAGLRTNSELHMIKYYITSK